MRDMDEYIIMQKKMIEMAEEYKEIQPILLAIFELIKRNPVLFNGFAVPGQHKLNTVFRFLSHFEATKDFFKMVEESKQYSEDV